MEDEPARRNGVTILKEVVTDRWQTNRGPPPIDVMALIKAFVATLERSKAKTWIIQQNVTHPKAIMSVASIPSGDQLKQYYSKTHLISRGTSNVVKYHLTFASEQDIDSIKQIPDVLEYIRANKLNVSANVFEGEKAVPIGCLLCVHPDPKKTNIIELEKDLHFSLNYDNIVAQESGATTENQRELKIKLIPKQALNRRLSQPEAINARAIEILATEQDIEEIQRRIREICLDSDHYHYGKFLSYSSPDCNICEALQEHDRYLKCHQLIALRANREVLLLATGETGSRMEEDILKHRSADGHTLFHRIDYNRKQDITRLHFVADNDQDEQEARKYADTTFKALYAETARVNRKDVEPVQNVFPRFLHYDYTLDPTCCFPPADVMPRRKTRHRKWPVEIKSNGQRYGSNVPQTPPTPGYGTPGGRPTPWIHVRIPRNDDASVASAATTAPDMDACVATAATSALDMGEVKRLIDESIQRHLGERDKEWEATKKELIKEQEAARTDIEALKGAHERLESMVDSKLVNLEQATAAILRAVQQSVLERGDSRHPRAQREPG
jgi:hypothetical protein